MRGLPSGTVTFLFTDIQGSTQLWQEHPRGMQIAVERHHALLHQAIQSSGGYVFQIVGDAFCAAFHTTLDGLQAALEAQRLLQNADWGDCGPLRVRMALHSGSVELHEGDHQSGEYRTGITLSHTSRVLSAAHGGQVLLSQAARDLLYEHLPEGVSLLCLGQVRLKDLRVPEYIYQVAAPDLPVDFPPPRNITAFPNNLPHKYSRFIGRKKEIAEIEASLHEHRLVTLAGAGGIGKTRLAIETAHNILSDYPDGAWLVELAPLSDPGLVLQQTASVLGVLESGEDSQNTAQQRLTLLARLTNALQEKQLLLILDNCEHVIDACAALVDHLLEHCSGLHILGTSRETLGVEGELVLRIPTLSLPKAEESDLDQLAASEAVQLFIDRASVTAPGFAMTGENAHFINQICIRLDGIALAIELAASRVKLLGVEQIAHRLDDAFHLLTGGGRTALPRQQTLHAAIDWSYQLLAEHERTLLERLSVFTGGWTLEAAERVCVGDEIEGTSILDLLSQLEHKSLMISEEPGVVCPWVQRRYRLLEMTRLYAQEKLAARGGEDRLHNQHMDYYLELAEVLEPKIDLRQRSIILKQLDAELDNFRLALKWAYDQPDSSSWRKGLRLASALWQYWDLRCYFQEGRGWLERGLALFSKSDQGVDFLLGKALYALGNLESFRNDITPTEALLGKSILIFRELRPEEDSYLAKALIASGFVYESQPERLKTLVKEGIAICRSSSPINGRELALGLAWLGHGFDIQRDYAPARAYAQESIQVSRQFDIPEDGHAACVLGNISIHQGDYESARRYFEESVHLFWEAEHKHKAIFHIGKLMGVHWLLRDYAAARARAEECSRAWHGLGELERRDLYHQLSGIYALFQGDHDIAEIRLRESLPKIYQNLHFGAELRYLSGMDNLALNLVGMAELRRIQGDEQRAGILVGCAEAYLESSGVQVTQGSPLERLITSLHGSLDQNAWQKGRTMSIDQVLPLALEEK